MFIILWLLVSVVLIKYYEKNFFFILSFVTINFEGSSPLSFTLSLSPASKTYVFVAVQKKFEIFYIFG